MDQPHSSGLPLGIGVLPAPAKSSPGNLERLRSSANLLKINYNHEDDASGNGFTHSTARFQKTFAIPLRLLAAKTSPSPFRVVRVIRGLKNHIQLGHSFLRSLASLLNMIF